MIRINEHYLKMQASYLFKDIGDRVAAFQDAGALRLVTDAQSLAVQLQDYHSDTSARTRDGEAARQVVLANRGALARLLKLLGAEIRALG